MIVARYACVRVRVRVCVSLRGIAGWRTGVTARVSAVVMRVEGRALKNRVAASELSAGLWPD